MDWQDEGVILTVRRHGESGAVVSLLTRSHGRHPGLVHGATSKANRGMLQPGNQVTAVWRGRLSEQLGTFRLEPLKSYAADAMADADRLAALASACALCEAALPERQPHGAAHEALMALLEALPSESWPSVYVHWELALLRALGYGLDLGSCAATGATEGLAYVSPKSARAVSLEAGQPYGDRMLPLPGFLVAGGEGRGREIFDGLRLAGFFLERHVFAPLRQGLPAARSRLVDRFRP